MIYALYILQSAAGCPCLMQSRSSQCTMRHKLPGSHGTLSECHYGTICHTMAHYDNLWNGMAHSRTPGTVFAHHVHSSAPCRKYPDSYVVLQRAHYGFLLSWVCSDKRRSSFLLILLIYWLYCQLKLFDVYTCYKTTPSYWLIMVSIQKGLIMSMIWILYNLNDGFQFNQFVNTMTNFTDDIFPTHSWY